MSTTVALPHGGASLLDLKQLLQLLGDSPGPTKLTSNGKVRLICRKLADKAQQENPAELAVWCRLYELVVRVLGQDTTLWEADFVRAVREAGVNLDRAAFDEVRLHGAIEDLWSHPKWGPEAVSPADPSIVERLPLLSNLLRPARQQPRGSAEFRRFI
jgi:hypothetical protein